MSADAYVAALTGAVSSKKSIKAQVAAMESFIAAAEQRLLPGSQIIHHILRSSTSLSRALHSCVLVPFRTHRRSSQEPAVQSLD